MTKKELSQLYYLNREIEHDKQRLAELRLAATSTTSVITGLPHVVGGITDKTALAADIADLEALIKNKIERTVIEYNRLMRYIESIDDSYIRDIMTLRHIDGLTWMQVTDVIGGSEYSIKQTYYRYLKKLSHMSH